MPPSNQLVYPEVFKIIVVSENQVCNCLDFSQNEFLRMYNPWGPFSVVVHLCNSWGPFALDIRKMVKLDCHGPRQITKYTIFCDSNFISGQSVNFRPTFLRQSPRNNECTTSTLDTFYFHVEENCCKSFY